MRYLNDSTQGFEKYVKFATNSFVCMGFVLAVSSCAIVPVKHLAFTALFDIFVRMF